MIHEGGVELPDGRVLAYATWGPATGRPVLFMHGCPGSRLQTFGLDVVERIGARVIAVDRPGIGRSSPQPGWTLTSWAPSVARLLDELDYDEVSICGHGAGGAAALAVAGAMPDRVHRVAIVSGGDPPDDPDALAALEEPDRETMRFVAADPAGAEASFAALAQGIAADPTTAVRLISSHWSDVDQLIGTRLELGDVLTDAYAEAARDPAGFARDSVISFTTWGFDPADVHARTTVWTGEHDVWRFHAADHGRALYDRLPNGELVSCPNDGATLLWNRAAQILQWLVL